MDIHELRQRYLGVKTKESLRTLASVAQVFLITGLVGAALMSANSALAAEIAEFKLLCQAVNPGNADDASFIISFELTTHDDGRITGRVGSTGLQGGAFSTNSDSFIANDTEFRLYPRGFEGNYYRLDRYSGILRWHSGRDGHAFTWTVQCRAIEEEDKKF